MENKKQELEKAKKRLEEIEPILNQTFKTSKELQRHMEKNKKLYEEGHLLFEQIQQLEWELMTPEEQEQYLKEEEISKLKREGKL